jgi:hypothetical protein
MTGFGGVLCVGETLRVGAPVNQRPDAMRLPARSGLERLRAASRSASSAAR